MNSASRQIHVWNQSTLRDLRQWLVSGRLPPGVVLDDLLPVVDMAMEGGVRARQKIADLENEVEHLQDELSGVEAEREDLQDRLDSLGG